jgi:hypothetical protein
MKGFRVVTCPWRNSACGIAQVDDMVSFRKGSTPEMKTRFLGIVETTWSSTQSFLDGYYGIAQQGRSAPTAAAGQGKAWNCFREVFQKIDAIGN